MPHILHPSGYCTWFNENTKGNLIAGDPCPLCKRTAGHHHTCLYFEETDSAGTTTRPKLFNAISVLRAISKKMYFITFTLQSRPGEKTYQVAPICRQHKKPDPDCLACSTSDLAVTAVFSKVMEAVSKRIRRGSRPNEITKFSYVWISEAQMQRQKKFGGIGDLHFHLVTNQRIEIQWLQQIWSSHFPDQGNRHSVHLEEIPAGINSVPAYLAKYLGKGTRRWIYSRRFACSRDLSSLAPIRLDTLPADLQPIRAHIFSTATGYEVCQYYFNTEAVIKRYGQMMVDEKAQQVTREGPQFTPEAILQRAQDRFKKRAARRIQDPSPTRPKYIYLDVADPFQF